MAAAAAGKFGEGLCPQYGLFPRGLLAVFDACAALRKAGQAVVLTASAVELSMVEGNNDMLARAEVLAERKAAAAKATHAKGWGGEHMGVALDRASKPPRLYGMEELVLESRAQLLDVFAALATRNTAGTQMNDSSSRSHCFAFLTLRVHDPAADTVRTSRFQFVDLAGEPRSFGIWVAFFSRCQRYRCEQARSG